MKAVILLRRKLGATSCREFARNSEEGLRVIRNDSPIPPDTELVFRWGCTSPVPEHAAVVNTANAIHRVNDKREFRRVLAQHGLAPRTWLSAEALYLQCAASELSLRYPLIVRPARHAQGRNLHACYSLDDVERVVQRMDRYYISEFFDKVVEYRVMVVQNRVAWVAQKTPGNPAEIAWNVARGGRFDNVRWSQWPLPAVNVALQAHRLSGLTFGGVDVMVNRDGEASVLEINSAPSHTSPYRQKCTAKAFDYIIRNGKEDFDTVYAQTWKDVIHPAVWNPADSST